MGVIGTGSSGIQCIPLIAEQAGDPGLAEREYRAELEEMKREGFLRARIDGEWVELDDPPRLDKKKKHTITFGYAGSNHSLSVAVFAKRIGLEPVSLHIPQPNAEYVRKNLLFQAFLGTELHHYSRTFPSRTPRYRHEP